MSGRILPFAFLLHLIFSCKPTPPVPDVNDHAIANLQDTIVYDYLQKPDSLFDAERYDSAIYYYDKAAKRYSIERSDAGYLRAIINLGKTKVVLEKYNDALYTLQNMSSEILSGQSGNYDLSKYYFVLGEVYSLLGVLDSSEIFFSKALDIRLCFFNSPGIDKAKTYLKLGDIHCYGLNDYLVSQYYYEKALKEATNLTDSAKDELLFYCNYNLATTNRYNRNLDRAEYYGKGALEATRSFGDRMYTRASHTLLASIYESKLDFDNAISHFTKAIEIDTSVSPINHINLVRDYNNLALNYSKKNVLDSAVYLYQKALAIERRHPLKMPSLRSRIHANMGVVYQKLNNDKLALYHFNKSVSLSESLGIRGYDDLIYSNLQLANYYYENRQFDLSIINYEAAIKLTVDTATSGEGVPEGAIRFPNPTKAYTLLNRIALACFNQALNDDSHNFQLLERALDSFLLADSLLQSNRKSNWLESDELWLGDNIQEYYNSALECVKLLYSQKSNIKYIKAAYEFIEQNKARILAKSLKKAEILKSVGVPDSLIMYWQKLNQLISHLQSQQKSLKGRNDEVEKRILNSVHEEELLNLHFKEKYEFYLKYRLHPQNYPLDSLQKLARNNSEIFLGFYNGHEQITALAIRPDTMFLYFIPFDSTFIAQIGSYGECLRSGNATSKKEYQQFVHSSYYLYTTLVKPALKNIDREESSKSVTIVADQVLSTIPFESLITEYPAGSSIIDYKSLSYFVTDYEISYQYSLSLFGGGQSKNANKIEFGGWGYETLSTSPAGEFQPINYSKQELEKTSSHYSRSLFFDYEATETSFKQNAENFDILHLSVHGASSSENQQPCLYFNSDHLNDGVLYPYELYNLKLKARLAVLSACETGLGKIHPGEGVYSIARGFSYAGCPSIVINLWKIKDNSSMALQDEFYKYLSKGQNKRKSLCMAKMTYIHNADKFTAHPAFWAAPVLIGSKEALHDQRPNNIIRAVIISLCLITALILIGTRFNRRYNRKSDKLPIL